ATFHRMCWVSLQATRGWACGATPVPNGPRHCGQECCASSSTRWPSVATASRQVSTRLPINNRIGTPGRLLARMVWGTHERFYAQGSRTCNYSISPLPGPKRSLGVSGRAPRAAGCCPGNWRPLRLDEVECGRSLRVPAATGPLPAHTTHVAAQGDGDVRGV